MSVLIYFTVPARTLRRFRVALDIEGCIDRFYGGYYSGKINLLNSICQYECDSYMILIRLGVRWTI